METFKIVNIDGREYTLSNTKTGAQYRLTFVFFDLPEPVVVGSIIAMHSELLDPNYAEYSTEYYFGPIDQQYGRKITGSGDIDLIGIKIGNKKIHLKRFFG